MNWHEVIDERSIELHGVIAVSCGRTPGSSISSWRGFQRFLDDPDRGRIQRAALQEWLQIIRQGLPAVNGRARGSQ